MLFLWDGCNAVNYDMVLVEPNPDGRHASDPVWSRYVSGTPTSSAINDAQAYPVVGDLVSIDAAGRAQRFFLHTTQPQLPFGIILGVALNPLVYPAFGGEYNNRIAVATLGVGSELFAYRITGDGLTNTGGDYVNPEAPPAAENIRVGDPVRLIYHRSRGRWGVRRSASGEAVHGVVLRIVDEPVFRHNEPDSSFVEQVKGLHIRLVQPFTAT
jgi:hypothetical protein